MEPTILDESNLVAFIQLNQGLKPEPIITDDGRVSFRFHEDVSRSIAEFYGGKLVSVTEFVNNVKQVRSMIFTLKKGRKN